MTAARRRPARWAATLCLLLLAAPGAARAGGSPSLVPGLYRGPGFVLFGIHDLGDRLYVSVSVRARPGTGGDGPARCELECLGPEHHGRAIPLRCTVLGDDSARGRAELLVDPGQRVRFRLRRGGGLGCRPKDRAIFGRGLPATVHDYLPPRRVTADLAYVRSDPTWARRTATDSDGILHRGWPVEIDDVRGGWCGFYHPAPRHPVAGDHHGGGWTPCANLDPHRHLRSAWRRALLGVWHAPAGDGDGGTRGDGTWLVLSDWGQYRRWSGAGPAPMEASGVFALTGRHRVTFWPYAKGAAPFTWTLRRRRGRLHAHGPGAPAAGLRPAPRPAHEAAPRIRLLPGGVGIPAGPGAPRPLPAAPETPTKEVRAILRAYRLSTSGDADPPVLTVRSQGGTVLLRVVLGPRAWVVRRVVVVSPRVRTANGVGVGSSRAELRRWLPTARPLGPPASPWIGWQGSRFHLAGAAAGPDGKAAAGRRIDRVVYGAPEHPPRPSK